LAVASPSSSVSNPH